VGRFAGAEVHVFKGAVKLHRNAAKQELKTGFIRKVAAYERGW